MIAVLDDICTTKREHVERCKQDLPLTEIEQQLGSVLPPHGFAQALERQVGLGKIGLIAEIKKASPSKGVIRADFDPPALANAYQDGGATCLSVLTDTPYFQGHDRFIDAVKGVSALPVLRKDFMLDPYQIAESRLLGADCILLILAALDQTLAHELEAQALELGMDVLLEVHDRTELDRALEMRSALIGINNRNLTTMQVELATSEVLAPHIPDGRLGICESGIATPADIARMQASGLHCFLIGESLMRQADVTAATRALIGG